MRLVHLGELFVDNSREALERSVDAVIGSKQAVDRRQLPLGQRPGRPIGCEINLVAGEQEPALAGFGGLYRVAQIDRGAARIARGDDFVEIDLGALAQPERHADDAEQREKSDQQQGGGGLNEEATGNGHAVTTARILQNAPADLRRSRPPRRDLGTRFNPDREDRRRGWQAAFPNTSRTRPPSPGRSSLARAAMCRCRG